jgi:hypothetical protein
LQKSDSVKSSSPVKNLKQKEVKKENNKIVSSIPGIEKGILLLNFHLII